MSKYIYTHTAVAKSANERKEVVHMRLNRTQDVFHKKKSFFSYAAFMSRLKKEL